MTTHSDLAAEERRLAILTALAATGDYKMSDSFLQAALSRVGHGVSLSLVRRDLAWLEEMGLIATSGLGGGMVLALLRNDGVDVAAGVACVPGVARPRPSW